MFFEEIMEFEEDEVMWFCHDMMHVFRYHSHTHRIIVMSIVLSRPVIVQSLAYFVPEIVGTRFDSARRKLYYCNDEEARHRVEPS